MPELLDRHSGRIKVSDYARPLNQQALEPYGKDKLGDYRNVMPQLLAPRSKGMKLEKGWAYSDTFDDHHWSVWRTDDFVQLVRHLKMDVVEIQDKDDKVGNGFTVVIRKKPLTK
jgi:hypothetical protein